MKKTKYNVGLITIMLVLSLLFSAGSQCAIAALSVEQTPVANRVVDIAESDDAMALPGEQQSVVDSIAAVVNDDDPIHDAEIVFCTDRVMLKDKHGNVKRDKHGFIRWGHEVCSGPPIWGVATFHKEHPFKDGKAVQRVFSVNYLLATNSRWHAPKRTSERLFSSKAEAMKYLADKQAQVKKDFGQEDVVVVFGGSNGSHLYYEGMCSAWKFVKSVKNRNKRIYVVFDYASRGNKPGLITYWHDRRIVGASEVDYEDAVNSIAQVVGPEHMIFKAHSMGCLLAVRVAKHFYDVFSGMKKVNPLAKLVPFKELDLIYGDVDLLQYEKDFAPFMVSMFSCRTIARSGKDKLLPTSHVINGKRRVGEKHKITDGDDIAGHIIWDCTADDCRWFGHAIDFINSEDLEEDGDAAPGWTKQLQRNENDCKHYIIKKCSGSRQ